MARLSKDCPDCGGKQPCQIELVPESETEPGTTVTYRVTCSTCGHVYAPDSPQVVTDAAGWAARARAQNSGSLLNPDGTPFVPAEEA